MKRNVFWTLIFSLCISVTAQEISPITLPDPDLKRAVSLMESLSKRASVREYKDSSISLQDLSNLLWAANGINRPEKKGRTAPSAFNAQDIDIYVIMATGAYLYDPVKHKLNVVQKGDFRKDIGNQAFVETAPVNLILVSDLSRFKRGDNNQKMQWAAFDAGVVSQNVSLYCASAGMGTVVRAMSDNDKMLVPLKLTNTQKIMLNHPVGYLK
jgi:SagB-type dehydrogenase family enzyme